MFLLLKCVQSLTAADYQFKKKKKKKKKKFKKKYFQGKKNCIFKNIC